MSEREVSSAAEALWLQHLSRRLGGEAVTPAMLQAAHPQFAREFELLEAEWRRSQESDGSETTPSSRVRDPGLQQELERLNARRKSNSSYELRDEIGRGGMGVVRRAWDESLRRELAHKTVHEQFGAAREKSLARFIEEAQITGQLDHPGIVPVHELGLDASGHVFFTMKLVKGEDLEVVFKHVQAGREGWNQVRALNVMLRVCEAIAFAHSKRVIHRDLKPANVMVGRFGEVYVMDWGVARVLGSKDRHDLRLKQDVTAHSSGVRTQRDDGREGACDSPLVTMDGDVIGTPSYMPPEQARGQLDKLGPHSDVYSIGAMLYRLVTARLPYVPADGRANQQAVLASVLRGPPEPIAALAPRTPPELIAIVEKAMERDIERRYSTTIDLAEDLRAYLDGRVVAAYETGAWAEASKWIQRNKALAGSLAAAALALVAGTVLSVGFARTAVANAARAERGESEARELSKRAEAGERQALESAKAAQLARSEAERTSNDVLALSAQKDHDDLVAEAATLWPAHPELIERYADWLRRARELIDGRPADTARGLKQRPSLAEHKAKLAELRRDAISPSEAQLQAEREAHPRYAELLGKRAELQWRTRMLALEPWPDEAAAEGALAEEELPTEAQALNSLAWVIVDPKQPEYGGELRALLLARRALAVASADQRSGIRDTLAWALFRLGRFDEALSEERKALSEPGAEPLSASAVVLETAIESWKGAQLAARHAERERLAAEVAALVAATGERQHYEFTDPEKAWWDRSLSKLVADLDALQSPTSGLMNDVMAEPFGWGVAKRYAFASSIGERSVDGPEARRLWSEAIAAIKASPKYGGLQIEPQMGLLPIGVDSDSQLWEFAHLQTGEAATRGADGKLILSEETGLVFVLLPGGMHTMGAQGSDAAARNYDPSAEDDEGPVHEVELSPYFLSKFEMTQGQWLRVAASNPSVLGPSRWQTKWNRLGHGWSSLHPVEQVSWPMCFELMERLGLRLPSEAQWEYGARGGTRSVYWCGDQPASLEAVANLADAYGKANGYGNWSTWEQQLDDGNSIHARIGSFRANPFGLHDVHGNVWEWCLDGYDARAYAKYGGRDPHSPWSGAAGRLIRGCGYTNVAASARVANRGDVPPQNRNAQLGLRPARELSGRRALPPNPR